MAQALRLLMLLTVALSFVRSAVAGPVVCTTTIEAPQGAHPSQKPLEFTRCGVVQTTPQLVEQRFYTYTSPFAPGVNITHQITDFLGIAMGGVDGTKLMGFGFPDQTIVWDGTALDNTYQVLLEKQSELIPRRSADVVNGFSSSLGSGGSLRAPQRGLW